MPRIQDNIQPILKTIPTGVTLVAVSKKKSAREMKEACLAGVWDFGENYVREFLEKKRELASALRWHFIGHLQRRKARDVVGEVVLIHSLDSHPLAFEIDKEAAKRNLVQNCLLEVNVGGEATKSGISPDEAEKLLREMSALKHVSIMGLMTLPPLLEDPECVRPYFRQLRELRDSLNAKNAYRFPLKELSMGMSHDYRVAIEEGATIVRIGTAIFGERK
ncbi:MAG: YggS family pyridoxal phosphate-dependent enzyme [Deltaproteobacteria bacterium]|nr:YggS family pyridoxal phosphate-dependent enzyme [Deltaproteobacteria bacterium]